MPEISRVLAFPARPNPRRVSLSPAEVLQQAQAYLSTSQAMRSKSLCDESLSNCDVLLAICKILRETLEVTPALVVSEASALYAWATKPSCAIGLFDEREYIQGESALIAAKGSRHLGKRDDAGRWLDRSEAA